MIVSAVEKLNDFLDKDLIEIKHVTWDSITDFFLVNGVVFKKTFSYANFEQQPKKFTDSKIIILNVDFELKAEKKNAEIRIEKPSDYQSIVDVEWKIDNIIKTGAKVVLSK